MPIGRIRNLTKYGVLTDVDPFNLPTEAWSMAINARFQAGSIVRAPVFRSVPVTLAGDDPRFVSANAQTDGFDNVIIGYLDGSVASVSNGTETDVSIAAYTPSAAELPYTSCRLANVYYVNRGDRVPWSFKSTDAQFHTLDNWDVTWTARLLRSCSGALCAFGITKSGTEYPTMIKTSEFALSDTVPVTWDETDPTNNATENILAEMEGGITDANVLGEIVIVYGQNETWRMVADGSQEVWSYHKLFNDAGAINANCSVEVNQQHFVFGLYDIWKHDGNSKVSICDLKTRQFIFAGLNVTKANRCHVTYDENLKELRFNYVTQDLYISFDNVGGCNRSAVYNLVEETWTFDDLPSVYSMWRANLSTSVTYTTVSGTYATIGGSYAGQADSSKKVQIAVGGTEATHSLTKSLYAVDVQGSGSLIAYPVDLNTVQPVQLRRDGIDLDELVDLRGYKEVTRIYPQARFEAGAQPLLFSFGSADYPSQTAVFSAFQSYDGLLDYHCDYHEGGRWLSMIIAYTDYHYFNLTGFDVEINVTGDV